MKNRSVLRVEAKVFSFLEKSKQTEFSQAISKYNNHPPEDERILRQIASSFPNKAKEQACACVYLNRPLTLAYNVLVCAPGIYFRKTQTLW